MHTVYVLKYIWLHISISFENTRLKKVFAIETVWLLELGSTMDNFLSYLGARFHIMFFLQAKNGNWAMGTADFLTISEEEVLQELLKVLFVGLFVSSRRKRRINMYLKSCLVSFPISSFPRHVKMFFLLQLLFSLSRKIKSLGIFPWLTDASVKWLSVEICWQKKRRPSSSFLAAGDKTNPWLQN